MRLFRPGSLTEAAEVLRAEGPEARLIAGGTDALVQLRGRFSPPSAWVDLSRVGGAPREISRDGSRVRIGALVSMFDLAHSPLIAETLHALSYAASDIGSRQIQVRATLGGNLCNASPAGDSIPPLMVADAQVEILGTDGSRELPLEEFFTGPGRTALAPDEVLAAVSYPVLEGGHSAFAVADNLAHHDISKVSAALRCRVAEGCLRDVRVALGAVAPTVIRAREVEALLEGGVPEVDLALKAGEAAKAAARPIDDIRSTAAYRSELSGRLVDWLVRGVGVTVYSSN